MCGRYVTCDSQDCLHSSPSCPPIAISFPSCYAIISAVDMESLNKLQPMDLFYWTYRQTGRYSSFAFGMSRVQIFSHRSTILIIKRFTSHTRSPGSSVGIATDYGLDGPGIESRWGRFSAPIQTGPGAHPASCTMGTGSFPGIESGRGLTLTPHPLLVSRSEKQSRAIPLLFVRAFVDCKKGETYLLHIPPAPQIRQWYYSCISFPVNYSLIIISLNLYS
jgi:hypothetical protein